VRQLGKPGTINVDRRPIWPEGRVDPSLAEAKRVLSASGWHASEEENHLREAGLPQKARTRPEPKLGLSCALAQEPLHVLARLRKEAVIAEAFATSSLFGHPPKWRTVEPSDHDA